MSIRPTTLHIRWVTQEWHLKQPRGSSNIVQSGCSMTSMWMLWVCLFNGVYLVDSFFISSNPSAYQPPEIQIVWHYELQRSCYVFTHALRGFGRISVLSGFAESTQHARIDSFVETDRTNHAFSNGIRITIGGRTAILKVAAPLFGHL